MTDGGRPKDVPVRPLLLAIIPESVVSRHTHPQEPRPAKAGHRWTRIPRPTIPGVPLGVVDRMLAQWQGYRQAVPSTGQISFANLEMCASVTPITGLFTAPDLSGPLALTWRASL